MDFKKMLINFRKKGYSDIIPFVCEGKEEIQKSMQYEVSMTVCMGRTTNQRKVPKCLPFKNYKPESLNIYMCAFLCLTLWQEEVCIDDANADGANDNANANANNHGQSMIV